MNADELHIFRGTSKKLLPSCRRSKYQCEFHVGLLRQLQLADKPACSLLLSPPPLTEVTLVAPVGPLQGILGRAQENF